MKLEVDESPKSEHDAGTGDSGGGVFSALITNFDLSGVPDLPLSDRDVLGVDGGAGLLGVVSLTLVDVCRY